MNIFTKIRLIITQPRTFWQKTNEAHEDWSDTLRAQFLIFLILNGITLAGYYLFGRFQTTSSLSQSKGFTIILGWITTHLAVSAILAPVVYLMGLFIFSVAGGLVITGLFYLFVKSYNNTASLLNIYKAFVYQAAVGIFLVVLGIIPSIPSLVYEIVGIVLLFWQIYIILLGVRTLCGLTKRQSIISFLSAVVCYIILFIVLFMAGMFFLVSGALRGTHNVSATSTLAFFLSTTTTATDTAYTYTDGVLSFSFPVSWAKPQTTEIQNTKIFQVTSPDGVNSFNILKTPHIDEVLGTTTNELSLASSFLLKENPGSMIPRSAMMTINNQPASFIETTIDGSDTDHMYLVIYKNTLYDFEFDAPSAKFSAEQSTFDQILKSISFQ